MHRISAVSGIESDYDVCMCDIENLPRKLLRPVMLAVLTRKNVTKMGRHYKITRLSSFIFRLFFRYVSHPRMVTWRD